MNIAQKQLRRLAGIAGGVLLISFWLGSAEGEAVAGLSPYQLDLGTAFPDLPLIASNPLTEEGVALGRYLFYDPILSVDSSISCSSCHDPRFAFSDSLRFSTGVDQLAGQRNSMPIINAAWMDRLFWDGRAANLEEQALRPVEDILEMHTSWKEVVGKLQQSSFYVPRFAAVFGARPIRQEMVVMAIAQFERTLISDNSKYDQVLRREASFTEKERLGMELFFTEKADCFHCHGNIFFTDMAFHDIGLDREPEDSGLGGFVGRKRDRGKFKTPTLRNLAFTGPYMHDGRFATLEAVVDFYSEGLQPSANIDPLMKHADRGGVHLNEEEKSALVAFLFTLTDSSFVAQEAFGNPFLEGRGASW